MGLISNFFKKLFGSAPTENNAPQRQDESNLSRWERERNDRASRAETSIKSWLANLLLEKKTLSFSWESGNDEAFVYFDGATKEEEDNFVDLEEYIIDKLDIPDAGEFEMNGNGTIFIDNNKVKAKYSSVMKETIDFNEETEEAVYGEEIQDGGEQVLFTI